MKLFRRREPKSSHPHSAALEHLSNAHKALMNDDAEAGRSHIGKAFAAVHHGIPKAATDTEGAREDAAEPSERSEMAPAMPPSKPNPSARLRGFNQRMP